MATLDEQRQASESAPLRLKVRQAALKAAQIIVDEPEATANHPNRLAWAKRVFANPDTVVDQGLLAYVIAKNSAAALSAIVNADDTTVQNAVTGAVDSLAP